MAWYDTLLDVASTVVGGPAGYVAKKLLSGEEGDIPVVGDALSGKVASKYTPYTTDDNAFEYGARQGKADEDADYYRGRTDQNVTRSSALQRQANDLQKAQYEDRMAQNDALGMQRAAALGNVPSRAEMLAQAQGDRAMAAQQSMAASARTPGGLAMAQQNAAANMARQQTDIANNASQLRAEEMGQARNAYAGQANQIRGADMQNQSLSQQGALGYQQAAQGWSAGERDVRGQQQQGYIEREKLRSSNYNAAQGANMASQEKAADRKMGVVTGAAGAAASALPLLASDERVKSTVENEKEPDGFEKFMKDFGSKYDEITSGIGGGGSMPGGGGYGISFGPGSAGSAQFLNKSVGAGIQGIGSLLSDVRKKNIIGDAEAAKMSAQADKMFGGGSQEMMRKAGDLERSQGAMYSSPAAMEQYLQSTKPAAYTYKEPGYGSPGVHVGPASAQEMRKNPIGATIVAPDKDGVLNMQGDKALKTTMSATSYVNEKADAALEQNKLLLDLINRQQQAMYGSPTANARERASGRGKE